MDWGLTERQGDLDVSKQGVVSFLVDAICIVSIL